MNLIMMGEPHMVDARLVCPSGHKQRRRITVIMKEEDGHFHPCDDTITCLAEGCQETITIPDPATEIIIPDDSYEERFDLFD